MKHSFNYFILQEVNKDNYPIKYRFVFYVFKEDLYSKHAIEKNFTCLHRLSCPVTIQRRKD